MKIMDCIEIWAKEWFTPADSVSHAIDILYAVPD
jgi:hypothetical protein